MEFPDQPVNILRLLHGVVIIKPQTWNVTDTQLISHQISYRAALLHQYLNDFIRRNRIVQKTDVNLCNPQVGSHGNFCNGQKARLWDVDLRDKNIAQYLLYFICQAVSTFKWPV